MPPRAIWSGSISFGLVNAPVRMYSAVQEKDLHFNLIHRPDGGRIGYQKVCKAEGDRPVPSDEIVRAYPFGDGEMVIVEEADFAAAEGETPRQLRILDFVPRDQIDPIYIERTYFLGPGDGGDRVYALLSNAMAKSGLAGVVRYVSHTKEHLGVLRVREDGVITLEKMYFADEIRSSEGIAPERSMGDVDDAELEMATKLIGSYAGDFDASKYRDRYRERLMEIIEAKREGGAVAPAAPAEEGAAPDLMAALRASLEAVTGEAA
ncbi:MAG: Ku protein [Thermoleophilia bacterium]